MGGEFIMVRVVDSDHALETRRCRVVHLADGTRAALWRGLAWPLSSGDRINLSGPAFTLLSEDRSDRPRFGLIDGADEAWLVLEGSVTTRDAVASELRRSGIAVLRVGPWLGEPVDGIPGTNFIRVVRPPEGDLRETITGIVGNTLTPGIERPDPADRARALTIELLEARAALVRAKAAQPVHTPEPSVTRETAIERLQQENAALLTEIADLQRQLTHAPLARLDTNRGTRRLEDELAISFTTLRPDLRFLRDSLTVVAGEFADRRAFYRAVLELNVNMMAGWKKLRGGSNWLERHLSTGQDDSGRIYARRSAYG